MPTQKLHLGASFPILELWDPGAIKAYAQAAEALGYDFISCIDHVLGVDKDSHPGYDPIPGATPHYFLYNRFHEQFTLFSYIAAVTERVRLLTSILILPQRQTALVAKQAAEVDILSKGRLILGVAVGHTDIEYKGLGMDFPTRGARIVEQIEVLRLLWTQPIVHYKGKFHELDGVGINPLPIQRPIPIWMGGWTEPVLRRIARTADGAVTPRDIPKLKTYLKAAGRDPEGFGFTGSVNVQRSELGKAIDNFKALAATGVTHFRISGDGQHYSIDEHIAALRQFKEAVGPSPWSV